jgi:hypothetical protein
MVRTLIRKIRNYGKKGGENNYPKQLNEHQKKVLIEKGVKKMVAQYGETFKLLSNT